MRFDSICKVIAKKHIMLGGVGALYERVVHRSGGNFLKVCSLEHGEPVVICCDENGKRLSNANPGDWSYNNMRNWKKVGKIDEI